MSEAAESLTDKEAQDYRNEFAKEVFGDDASTAAEPAPIDDGEKPPEKPPENPPEPDPLEGVSPAVKEMLEGMKATVDGLGTIGDRLKQAESRIGSIDNRLSEANKAAASMEKEKKEAPTEAEIEAASKSQEQWDELKEEFPEWAKAVDARFAATSAELDKRSKGLENRLAALEQKGGSPEEVSQLRREFSENIVELKHRDWKKTVNTEEFKTFFSGLDAEKKALANSVNPMDTIEVLDLFQESQNPSGQRTAAQIKADREARLKSSVNPSSGRTRKPAKTEDDMSDDEYRKKLSGKWEDL